MRSKVKIYVASSWRNRRQEGVVDSLRSQGFEVYDFKNPPNKSGFGWHQIDPDWQNWNFKQYKASLNHELAINGFISDFDAMKWADACLLLLPCGRSAHIEAGYFVGASKPLVIMIEKLEEPELMYKMANEVVETLHDAIKIFRSITNEK